jgi:hypothetical protein
MQEDPLGILGNSDPLGILKKKDGGSTPSQATPALTSQPQEDLASLLTRRKKLEGEKSAVRPTAAPGFVATPTVDYDSQISAIDAEIFNKGFDPKEVSKDFTDIDVYGTDEEFRTFYDKKKTKPLTAGRDLSAKTWHNQSRSAINANEDPNTKAELNLELDNLISQGAQLPKADFNTALNYGRNAKEQILKFTGEQGDAREKAIQNFKKDYIPVLGNVLLRDRAAVGDSKTLPIDLALAVGDIFDPARSAQTREIMSADYSDNYQAQAAKERRLAEVESEGLKILSDAVTQEYEDKQDSFTGLKQWEENKGGRLKELLNKIGKIQPADKAIVDQYNKQKSELDALIKSPEFTQIEGQSKNIDTALAAYEKETDPLKKQRLYDAYAGEVDLYNIMVESAPQVSEKTKALNDIASQINSSVLPKEEIDEYNNLVSEYGNISKGAINTQSGLEPWVKYIKDKKDSQFKRYPTVMADELMAAEQEWKGENLSTPSKFVVGLSKLGEGAADALSVIYDSLFATDEQALKNDFERLGRSQTESTILGYEREANRLYESPMTTVISDKTKGRLTEIEDNPELSADQKKMMSSAILKEGLESGDVYKTTNPNAGKINITAKSVLNTFATVGPQMLGSIGAAALTGGGTGSLFITTAMQAFSPYYNEAVEKGIANPIQYATAHTLVEAATELLGTTDLDIIKKTFQNKSGFGAKFFRDLSKGEFDKLLAGSKGAFKNYTKAIGRGLRSNFEEASEEFLAPIGGNIADQYLFGEKRPIMEGATQGFTTMAIGGLPLSMLGVPLSVRNTDIGKKFALYNAAADLRGTLSTLSEEYKAGNLSKQEYEDRVKMITDYSSIVRMMPQAYEDGSPLRDDHKAKLAFNTYITTRKVENSLPPQQKSKIEQVINDTQTESDKILANATTQSNIQEGRTEGDISQYQGNVQGQPEVGQGEGQQGQTQITQPNVGDSNISGQAEVAERITPEQIEVTNDATGFSEQVTAAKESLGNEGLSVSPYEQDNYDKIASEGGQFLRAADNQVLALLKPNGEMVSLVKAKTANVKGAAQALITKMKDMGGLFMDNYDIYLTPIYEKAGYKVAARVPFNEQYAPEGWNAEDSPLKTKPDVVFMVRQDLAPADAQTYENYDDAQAFTQGIIDNAVSTGKATLPSVQAEAVQAPTMAEELQQFMAETPMDESIAIAEESLAKTGIKFKTIDDANAPQGLFTSDTGEITINRAKLADDIEAGVVVWHEASHPVMNIIRNTNKPLYDAVVRGLQDAAKKNSSIDDALAWAQSQPEYDNVDTQNDEAIVETIGRINAGLIDINSLDAGFKQKLIDFVNNIAKFFGIDPIINDTDIAQFKKTVSEVADALKTGRDIAEIVGEENVKATSAQMNQLRATSAEIAKATEDKTVSGKSQPSMVLVGKQAGKDVDLYSGPASIEDLRSVKPGMYISRAEALSESALVPGKTRSYPSTASTEAKLKWADNVYKKAKETVVSNILDIHDSIDPAIRDISKLWYDGANIIAQELSKLYNTSLEQSSAVIATQSPQKPWYDNVHLAHFIMDFYANNKDKVMDQGMYDYFFEKSQPTKANKAGYPKQTQYLPTLQKAIGKPFKDLSNYDKAVMIRAEFDRNYERKAPLRIPTGVIVGRVNSMSSFSGYDTIAKAVSILEDGSDKNISDNLGKAYKVRNFYNNIADPKMDGEVTIDTHAMAAAYMLPLGSSSPEVQFDEATYAFFADAYRDAASQRGILAREMQSITWEGVRSVFPAADKSDANKARAKEIWAGYKNGTTTLKEVQEQIKANGKDLSITDWSRFTDKLLEEDGKPSYIEELSLAGGDRAAVGQRDGGGNIGGVPGMGEGGVQPSGQLSAGNRLAPNGKPSKLNAKQYEQVRTPEFKAWFGDWENDPANASKVVDENGEPRVVFHGTNNTFDEFKKEKLGSKNFTADSAYMGFFFAGDRSTSEEYTGMNSMDMMGVSLGAYNDIFDKYKVELDTAKSAVDNIYKDIFARVEAETIEKNLPRAEETRRSLREANVPVDYIEELIKNLVNKVDTEKVYNEAKVENDRNGNNQRLAEVNEKINSEIEDKWRSRTGANPQIMELFLNIKDPLTVDYSNIEATNLASDIQEAIGTGKDGVVFNNLKDGAKADDIFVALEPNQIKSATENVGTFSTEDNRIQFSAANRPEFSKDFKLGAFVMRKKAEGASDAEIAGAVASVTQMSKAEIDKLISDPEQFIRDSFPSFSKQRQDNLIERAKMKNIYRGRQFGKPIDKKFVGLEIPRNLVDQYMAQNGRKDNVAKKIYTDFKKKWLDPAKGLPDWVLAIKDFSKGTKNIEIARAAKTIERLKAEAKRIGFQDWDAFSKAMVVANNVQRFIPEEDGIVPFDPYRAYEGRTFTAQDDQLPSLVPDEIKALPEEIIPYVYAMRGQIDRLTKDLIGSGYVTPDQAVTLERNIGQYVNRAYKLFNEKGYKPEPEALNAAVNYLANERFQGLLTDYFNTQQGISPDKVLTAEDQAQRDQDYQDFVNKIEDAEKLRLLEEALRLAQADVNAILEKKTNPYFGLSEDKRDVGILQNRKDISEPIRKLMGEYTDPGTTFMMTVAKQAALKGASEYLTKLREFGMGTLFFEAKDPSRPASHSVQVASTGTESMSPLGGLYTTPEIYEAIQSIEPTYNAMVQAWMKLVGYVRWGKTVGSVATQFKNFESNLGFAVLNGLLFTGNNGEAFRGAAQYVKGQYSKAEIDALTEKLIKLNLVGQSVGARELKEMLGGGDLHDIALDISLSPEGKWGKKVAKRYNVFKEANKLYRLGDDFWKAYAYLNERQVVANGRFEAPYESLTKEQQDQVDLESSERVKSTWPTYDRVVEGAKVISKNIPIFGNFISFQAESLRVLNNSIKLAKKDLSDPQMKSAGMKRMAGIVSYFMLRTGITTVAAKLSGMAASGLIGAVMGDDDEERRKNAIKQAAPIFMRAGDLATIQGDKPHKFTIVDMSSLDPYGIIPRSLNAYTDGREGIFGAQMEPGVMAAGTELFSAFLEPEMTFSTMWSARNNTDPKNKQKMVLENDTDIQSVAKVAGAIWDQLEPSSIALIQRMFTTERPAAEVLALFGARPYEIDLHKSFSIILSKAGDDLSAINTEYNKIKYNEKATPEEKKSAEKIAEDKKAFAISKLNQIYRDFILTGADPNELNAIINQKSAIKTTGFDVITKKGIKTGNISREKLFKPK